MASKHCGESPLGRLTSRWRRRLCFEPLEERRLLAVIPVTTTVDENNGTGLVSLREAVGLANSGDTITFSVNGTIQLLGTSGLGQITINKSLTIQGPGSNLLTVRAFNPTVGATHNDGRRAFLIQDFSSSLNVTISGLTLTNGDPTVLDENDGGGAIRSSENLTLNACVLTGNFSPNGGTIYSTDGALTLNDCTISGNSSADGGTLLVTGGSLAINRSTIANNQASNSGGGIASRSRPVTIVDSTISGNESSESGGGIYLTGSTLSVTNSTISNNSAGTNQDGIGGGGGGLFNVTGSISIINSTVSGNSSLDGGGGIFSDTSQSVTIAHSTITGNTTSVSFGANGGGIKSLNVVSLDHTIVAGNLRGASTRDDVFGNFNAYFSLIGDKGNQNVNDTGGSKIGQNGSVSNPPIDPMLGLLANNGGPTLTHVPLSGSPALEAGNPAAAAGSGGVPQFDQRGTPFSRVVDFDGAAGAQIDIGAIEMTSAAPTLPGDYNLNHAVDAGDYVLWRKTTGSSVPQPYSGADGDGNSAVNSDDYTVWRAHFGNGPGAAAGASLGESDESASADRASTSLGNANALAMTFVGSSTRSRADMDRPGIIVRESQAVAVDAAIELLLLSGRGNALGDRTAADDDATSRDSTDATSFAPLTGNSGFDGFELRATPETTAASL